MSTEGRTALLYLAWKGGLVSPPLKEFPVTALIPTLVTGKPRRDHLAWASQPRSDTISK